MGDVTYKSLSTDRAEEAPELTTFGCIGRVLLTSVLAFCGLIVLLMIGASTGIIFPPGGR